MGIKQVTVSLDDTIILDGGGDKKLIEDRCEQVKFKYSYLLFFSTILMPIIRGASSINLVGFQQLLNSQIHG